MFLQLGTYKFQGIKLPQSLSLNLETTYGEIPIINDLPVVQRTGNKLIEIEIGAFFSVEFCKPRDEVSKLNDSRVAGEVMSLVDGTGWNHGNYVIKTIKVTYENCLDNGYPLGIAISLSLMQYNSKTVRVVTGNALTSSQPESETPLTPVPGPAQSIDADITEGINTSSQISAASVETVSEAKYSKLATMATAAKAAFTSANNKINATKKIIYRAQDLKNDVTAAVEAAEEIKNACQIHNFNDLMLANSRMAAATDRMSSSRIPVTTFAATREGGN